MTWGATATEILDAAIGSGVEVCRAFVAPGPGFGQYDSLLAVVLDTTAIERPDHRRGLPLELCAAVPVLAFTVVYVDDCVPVIDPAAPAPPPADDLTGWSTAFLDKCELVHAGLLGLDPQRYQVGDARWSGPSGRKATMRVPVRTAELAEWAG